MGSSYAWQGHQHVALHSWRDEEAGTDWFRCSCGMLSGMVASGMFAHSTGYMTPNDAKKLLGARRWQKLREHIAGTMARDALNKQNARCTCGGGEWTAERGAHEWHSMTCEMEQVTQLAWERALERFDDIDEHVREMQGGDQ